MGRKESNQTQNQDLQLEIYQYQLVELYYTFCWALDKCEDVCAVFCNISKAFDRGWHMDLTAKLKHYGICGQ